MLVPVQQAEQPYLLTLQETNISFYEKGNSPSLDMLVPERVTILLILLEEILHQVVYPIIYKILYILGVEHRISEPSTTKLRGRQLPSLQGSR